MKIKIPKISIVREDYSVVDVVPRKLKNYLTDMNYILAHSDSDVSCGREKEVKRIFNSLLKQHNSNIMLLGDHGVGKNATLQIAIYDVLKKKCPTPFYNYHFIYCDIEKMLVTLKNEEKNNISDVFEFLLSYNNLVVVIDQVHLAACSLGIMYYFKQMLKSNNVSVIGISTEYDFYDYFEYYEKVISMVDIITIKEPKPTKIYPMIKKYLKSYEELYKVKIPEDIVIYTSSVASAFSSVLCNPGLVIDLLEKSIVVAHANGHKSVLRKDVNCNFNFEYDLYNQMSEQDKKTIAYHEAGHFIVAKLSENIKNYKTKAITIVPSKYFVGVTMFEFELEKQMSMDSDYFIDNIAVDLAGRVAEMILQGKGDESKYTSGASSDLKNATSTARAIVTEYGMIKSCGENMTYFCDYDLSDLVLLSEETKGKIEQETQNLIKIAYEKAKSILTENRKLLDTIADALLKSEVLDEKDLDILCNNYKDS